MTKVLMSAANPTGWKLEDLMEAVIADIETKNARVAADVRPTAVEVRRLNCASIYSLKSVLMNQRLVLDELARIGTDQGPTGTPRIGAGSKPPFGAHVSSEERAFVDGLDPEAVVVVATGPRREWMERTIFDRHDRRQRVVTVNDRGRIVSLNGLRNIALDPSYFVMAPAALTHEVEAFINACNATRSRP